MSHFAPKPEWLKVRAPGGDTFHHLQKTFRELDLHTVCEEARCPNVGECWREGTATVMLLGDVCTRGCRFCAVTTGDPRGAVDVREPEHVARAIARLDLAYVVLTMVDRDDLLDGGAEHVARTVRRLRELRPDILIETLVGDFAGHLGAVDTLATEPDVFAHNVETVRRLTRTVRDARCSYDQSLAVLRRARERLDAAPPGPSGTATMGETPKPPAQPVRRLTKSSVMVGLGETDDEVLETLGDLRAAGVDVVTLGQYLRPSPKHHEVVRYVEPSTFAAWEKAAIGMGFLHASCGPLVRSSYRAAEVFVRSLLTGEVADPAKIDATLHARLDEARRGARRVSAALADDAPPTALSGAGLLPPGSLVRRA